MKKIFIFLVLVLVFFGCAVDSLIADTGEFDNLPEWAQGIEIQGRTDHDCWSVYKNGIRHTGIDGFTVMFTPEHSMIVTLGENCFLIVTEYETIKFELDGDTIWIKWYNAE